MTKSGIAFDFIVALGFIAIGVLAIEGFVRFIADDGKQSDLEMWKYARDVKRISDDPLVGHEHRPNRQAKLMGVDFRTNSKGLRDREFSYAKPPGRLRILMLGDSLTVGWGVAIEDTFAKRVERMYAGHGIDAEVINAGVGNYNTIQEVEYFFTEGHKYHPDVIVLNYFVNDAEPVLQQHRPSIFERVCFACVFIAGRLDTLLRTISIKQDWADYYSSLYDDGKTKGWLDAKENIRMLAEYCKANSIRLLIASLPELHDVSHYRFQTITDLLQDAAKQYGAEFVDILPYVAQQRSSNLWLTPSGLRPNALAHDLVARGLFEALERHREAGSDRACGWQGPRPVGAK